MTNPRMKDSVQKAVISFVFDPFEAYVNRKVDKIILSNTKLTHATQYGFIYKGKTFIGSQKTLLRPPYPRLHKDLFSEMDKILKEIDTVELYEIPLLKGILCSVMNLSNYPMEFFKLIPEEFHQPLLVWKSQLAPTPVALELPDAQVQAFRQKYESTFDVFRLRLITNLIL